MNNVHPLGGWLDDLTSSISDFFTGGSAADYSPTSGLINWGETLGQTKPDYQYDTTDFTNYWLRGGVMGGGTTGTYTGGTGAGSTSHLTGSSDIFFGLSNTVTDFISGATSALTDLFSAGTSAYATVQKLINSQNPTDVIVNRPELGGAVVQRTQNGQTTYIPLLSAYPQFASQINTANKSSSTNALIMAGVLGLGLVLILKKK